mmetsp:Transcript_5427/g.18961  ORF Transcript_5427/g.18961 Transcript_5427/m.18961 type:complete len:411 (-) Transcript_5427:1277-2509(-)
MCSQAARLLLRSGHSAQLFWATSHRKAPEKNSNFSEAEEAKRFSASSRAEQNELLGRPPSEIPRSSDPTGSPARLQYTSRKCRQRAHFSFSSMASHMEKSSQTASQWAPSSAPRWRDETSRSRHTMADSWHPELRRSAAAAPGLFQDAQAGRAQALSSPPPPEDSMILSRSACSLDLSPSASSPSPSLACIAKRADTALSPDPSSKWDDLLPLASFADTSLVSKLIRSSSVAKGRLLTAPVRIMESSIAPKSDSWIDRSAASDSASRALPSPPLASSPPPLGEEIEASTAAETSRRKAFSPPQTLPPLPPRLQHTRAQSAMANAAAEAASEPTPLPCSARTCILSMAMAAWASTLALIPSFPLTIASALAGCCAASSSQLTSRSPRPANSKSSSAFPKSPLFRARHAATL